MALRPVYPLPQLVPVRRPASQIVRPPTAGAVVFTGTASAAGAASVTAAVTQIAPGTAAGTGSVTAAGTVTAPGLVQSKQGHSTASPLAITLDGATTAGNGLIVVIGHTGSSNNGTVSGITLGGAAGNFAAAATSGSASADTAVMDCWLDLNCAGGQTAVSIAFSGASGTTDFYAAVYERNDLPAVSAFDKSSGNPVDASSSSWTSNATATTTQASEIWAGGVLLVGGSAITATGPSSPWTNLAAQAATNGSVQTAWVSGWRAVAATGTATYSGTVSPAAGTGYTALAVTLKAVTAGIITGTAAAAGAGAATAAATQIPAAATLAGAASVTAAVTQIAPGNGRDRSPPPGRSSSPAPPARPDPVPPLL